MKQILKRLIDTDEIVDEWGVSKEVQEKLRREGQFAPWLRIGRRIYVVREEWERWIDEQKAKTASAPAGAPPEALTLGDDTLAQTLARIIQTAPSPEEVRTRVAELLGADERLWDGGGNDAA
jgi:hypothetical protein